MSEETNDLFGESPETEIQASQLDLYRERYLKPESQEAISRALNTDAVARRILAKGLEIEMGAVYGVRLNINVLKSTGVCVHSIHRGTQTGGHTKGKGFFRGEVISYLPVVLLHDAYFNVHQKGREGIANGAMAKHPMASIDGVLRQSETPSFHGVEVSFNPKTTHLFVDSEGYALQYAQEVTILGHRAYARGLLRYFGKNTQPQRAGSAPSFAKFRG